MCDRKLVRLSGDDFGVVIVDMFGEVVGLCDGYGIVFLWFVDIGSWSVSWCLFVGNCCCVVDGVLFEEVYFEGRIDVVGDRVFVLLIIEFLNCTDNCSGLGFDFCLKGWDCYFDDFGCVLGDGYIFKVVWNRFVVNGGGRSCGIVICSGWCRWWNSKCNVGIGRSVCCVGRFGVFICWMCWVVGWVVLLFVGIWLED